MTRLIMFVFILFITLFTVTFIRKAHKNKNLLTDDEKAEAVIKNWYMRDGTGGDYAKFRANMYKKHSKEELIRSYNQFF